ncbi:ribosomal protein S18 acetylase RimI-like enzyme [Bradyrhizobium macuxiense]|uniref:Ribosomal protein S18 acetylase RimI-like enzyme n=1 Tax=Bradyrhizobium macuxiense TaxID=1755647 RepID=A0A560LYD7_9BRAD|nr:GNAT family N-acetyltransferase [Bradyrhizobium macuxiense]TWC00220.1 ribosomal protein S18 acetylase RimI-like enzyme [Bradyrhizobium macuxiense]
MNRSEIVLRPARAGDGRSLFDVTVQSVQGLGKSHYTSEQLAGWMGERTAEHYEDIIKSGRTVLAEHRGEVVGFVASDPGEVTRLFLLPKAAGQGLGKRLLEAGVENAKMGYSGSIRIESTLNAQGFYEHHGFRAIEKGYFSHGVGGDPIEVVLMEMAQT